MKGDITPNAMKEILATITQRGQVTVPAEVRRLLRVGPRDKLVFAIDDAQVRLLPAAFTLEKAFGSVTPKNRPEDFEALSQAAKDEHAEKVTRKMRQG